MKLGKKDVLFVEFLFQHVMRDVFVVGQYSEQNQEVRRNNYFFAALTNDTTSLSLNW